MLLKDVLCVLAECSDGMGFRRSDLYITLFNGAELEDQLAENAEYGVDDIAKKHFSGRPLNAKLTHKILTREGFDRLCRNIRMDYLDMVGTHDKVFQLLSGLVIECPMMGAINKEALLDSCDGTQPDELARFIAACIVCGNFNAIEHKKTTGNRLSLNYMNLGISLRFSVRKAPPVSRKRNFAWYEVYIDDVVVYASDDIYGVIDKDKNEAFQGLFSAKLTRLVKAYPKEKMEDLVRLTYNFAIQDAASEGYDKIDKVMMTFAENDSNILLFSIDISPDSTNTEQLQYGLLDWTENDLVMVRGEDWMK